MSRWIGVLALVAFGCAACGGDAPQAPASPSSGSGVASVTQGARILGNVSAGQPLAAMAAQVVGTSLSSPVNSGGGFSLDNVPAGAVQLRFVGSGVDASVGLNPVQPGDVVSVLVGVAGATATIQSESRNAGGKVELEGRIEAFPKEEGDQKDNLVVAGRTVEVTEATVIWKGSSKLDFEDLQIGQRVHVKGTLGADAIVADSITLQNTNEWIPVNVNGIVEVLETDAADLPEGFTFLFRIGSRVIQGDGETKFYGEDDAPASLKDLKNGQRVEVKGELRDGFVYAFRIHISGLTATPNPPQDDSASVEGILLAESDLGADYPTLYLDTKFGKARVTTTSATVVQRRGSVVDFKALDIGQTIHAVGTRLNDMDKTLEAKFLQIKDDAAEGWFVIDGSLGGLKGACPAVSFGVNGYTVFTTGTTPPAASDTVYSPSSMTCSDLKNGMKVGVEGYRQADGTVKASTITKK